MARVPRKVLVDEPLVVADVEAVSAPSSVTNTSPCWNGLIVPGSTFRYGSNFCALTVRPRDFSRRPSDAATIPLPSAETTPP